MNRFAIKLTLSFLLMLIITWGLANSYPKSAILFSIVFILLLTFFISRRLKSIYRLALQLASGKYNARLNTSFNDEWGLLEKTLNQLGDKIQETLAEISFDKSRLSTILSSMKDAVAALDINGHIQIINPAFSALFNVTPESSLGKTFLEALRHHQLNQMIHSVLEKKEPQTDEITTWGSGEFTFQAQAVPLLQDGKCTGVLLVLHDITRLRKLEQIRKDFVANVSHELRTPLAAIKGFAETLREGALEDPKNRLDFVTSIEQQSDRMINLTNDLLDLTAIESGKETPVKTDVNVKDLVDDVIHTIRSLAKKSNISIQNDISTEPVPCNYNQFKQVFMNLITNAVKFNKQGGTIHLSSERDSNQVVFTVKDSGIGIPSQDTGRIFERFYRVDKARSRDLGGTGLGLAIVKHVIEAHGGTIRVESILGQGSAFIFTLPL